ncbi:hypothetical protein WJX81_005823 [Elliptochloris bilobata]|uniref:Uncharacterized protein n=1 Tax=Elliptochloris bilobata TaxID=381761 RepID=A0AAW1RU92_9CHLO
MAALSADVGEAVLKVVMADGTFDDLRQQLVAQLKKDAALLEYAEDAVAESCALRSVGASTSKKEVFDSVRRELEEELLRRALQTTWDVLTPSEQPISAQIDQKVHEALCTVHQQREQARQERARRRGAAAPPDAAVGFKGR